MPVRRRYLLTGLAASTLLAACSGSGERGAAAIPSETIPSDAVHIVGTTEEIARIADIQPSSDVVWVLNTVEPFFVAFDMNGEVVRSHGNQGGGPDEFRSPNTIVGSPSSGEAWVYDRAAHTLVSISDPEDTKRTIRLSTDSLPGGRVMSHDNSGTGDGRYWIRSASDGFLFLRARPGARNIAQLWRVDLVEHGADESFHTRFSPTEVLDHPATLYSENVTDFLPFPIVDVCADGGVVMYDPQANAVRRFSQDGTLTGSDSLPPPRNLELTLDRVFSMIFPYMLESQLMGVELPDTAQLKEMLAAEWPEASARMAPVFPEYVDMYCAGGNAVWLQPTDVETGMMGRGPAWIRIGPDGQARRIVLPAEFRPMRFTGDRIWGIQRGEFDIESVAWIDFQPATD